jgi:MoaA/NifB/PqqE/SkfB family radical SAM enzyme
MKFDPESLKLFRRVLEMNIPAAIYGFVRYGVGDLVRLEACSLCQLRCPVCLQSTNDMGIVGYGYLRFDDFRRFVDRYPHFKRIELSNFGEIFLNPELEEIISYAYSKKIRLTAFNGVNFNRISRAMLQSLVKYSFHSLTFSIDGASEETYGIYRRGGNFNAVIENIRTLNHFKKVEGSPYPRLRWQFIVFGHNEHELPIAREMARELDMEFYPRLNYRTGYSPVKNPDFVRAAAKIKTVSVVEYSHKYGVKYQHYCEQLWLAPQINWDGQMLGCCVNHWGNFGNVFKDGLEACLTSEKYRYAKKMLLGLAPQRNDIACVQCKRYQIMKETRRFLVPFLAPKQP